MKILRIYLSILIVVLTSFTLIGQNVKASLTAKQYLYQDTLTLVDLYFNISTDQLRLKEEGGFDYLNVGVNVLVKDTFDTMVYEHKINLKPKLSDLFSNYILSRKQIVLKPGSYSLTIELSDENSKISPRKNTFNYIVDNKKELHFSDVFCFENGTPAEKEHSLHKNGMALFPKFQNGDYLFNIEDTLLNYYVELYDIKSEEPIFMEVFIREKTSSMGIKSTYSVREIKPINKKVIVKSINLSELSSGNYEFIISIFTESKKQLALNRMFFQKISLAKKKEKIDRKEEIRNLYKKTLLEKYNLNDIHRLNQIIAAMALTESKQERRPFYNVIDNKDIELKHNFFFNHWEEKNRLHPQYAIENFINIFESVQRKFAFREEDGYQTDQGRVYIEYGKPDDIELKSVDNKSAPYEIWHYYKLDNGEGNVIFVFYENKSYGNFDLIHSSAIDELSNPQWEQILEQLNQSSTQRN